MNIKNNENCKTIINDEEVEKYTIKPEIADKMFEKLGYKKYNELQSCRYVRYCDIVNGEKEYIIFSKNKTVRFQYLYTHVSKNITMEELQAINKKCKELRLDIIKINNLKESIEYFKKINNYGTDKEPYYLQYELSEAPISFEWYKAILNKIKKYKPKRVIDIGSNINLFGYLFANEGIEYIGIDIDSDGCKPIEIKNIKFVKANYYDVAEQFKNDICISCLCVGYLIPFADVKCKKLIINSDNGDEYNYKCTAKEIKK